MPTTDRRCRALLAALVLVLGCVGLAPAAGAQTPDDHAWVATGPLAPTGAEERIYVSQVAGQEQARSFVRVPDATADQLRGAEVTLTEAEGGLAPDSAELRACAPAAPVQGSGKVDDAPEIDCTTSAPLVRDAAGTWTVVLTPLAETVAGEAGGWFAVVPTGADPTTTFTVVFDTAATTAAVGADMGGTPADDSGTQDVVTSPSADPTAPSAPSSFPSSPSLVDVGPGPLLSDPNLEVPPSQLAGREDAGPSAAPRLPNLPRRLREGVSPPAWVLLLLALVVGLVLTAWGRWLPPVTTRGVTVQSGTVLSGAALAVLLALVSLLSEAAVYKLGFIGIVFIAAIGLHLLVNWSGELSLAHASFVGLPAFMVAQLADRTGWTPIVFLPVGVAVGALLGLFVAIPARRARGLQVALVTLAVGIAITQFLFVRSWVIGPPSGLEIPVPSLFGFRFETSRSLLPVLVAVIAVAVVAARAILASTIGRALSQVRLVPDAAATAGVPVAAYRGAAYALAGAFAGLAGGAYVLWVQRVGPQAFPLNLGFTYLVIATLAGKGGLLGVALAALMLEGGRLFSIIPESIGLYLGPIALIYNVTRYQEGINGVLRQVGRQLRARSVKVMDEQRERSTVVVGTTVRLPVVVAGVIIAVGLGAIALAWYHAGNTDQLWIQNQEMLSGGFGGGALVLLGSALLIRDALLEGRGTLRRTTALSPADD